MKLRQLLVLFLVLQFSLAENGDFDEAEFDYNCESIPFSAELKYISKKLKTFFIGLQHSMNLLEGIIQNI